MLKKYRSKFILSNMVLIGIVIFVMLCAIFVYNYREAMQSLENTMYQTLSPVMGTSSEPSERREPPSESEKNAGEPRRSGEKPLSAPKKPDSEVNRDEVVSVMFYTPSTDKISVISHSLIQNEEELEEIVKAISSMPDGFGKLSSRGIYYYVVHTHTDDKIAIADTDFVTSKMLKLLLLLLSIFVVTMLLFLEVSHRLSAFAAKPLETSILREKQFIADASHDLKTPVAVILANISIIKGKKYSGEDELNKWLSSTEDAAYNIKRLVEEMLELSEMDHKTRSVKLTPINISEIAEKSVLFMESVAYDKGIEYVYDIAEDIYSDADSDCVGKIFASLIENALKYEKSGSKISISLAKSAGRATFSINNKSALIAPEDIPYVFERFYRSDKSRRDGSSHGLGLAIVKKTADVINAAVSVESNPREGTTFTVVFKVMQKDSRKPRKP